MQQITVTTGLYRKTKLVNRKFSWDGRLFAAGKNTFINAVNTEYSDLPMRRIRVWIKEKDIAVGETQSALAVDDNVIDFVSKEVSDAQISSEIKEKFEILDTLVHGIAESKIKGLVVCGAAGVGKSFNIQRKLEMMGFENYLLTQENSEDDEESDSGLGIDFNELPTKYFVTIKGRVTALGLFNILSLHRDKIVVFDDTDSIFEDSTCLNLLKAALDSYEKRTLCWNSRGNSRKFDFTGTVIFISNIHFDQVKEGSKLKSHIDAIMSRTHFLDLSMKTNREKILRIKQVVQESDLFHNYDLNDTQKEEIIQFIYKNQNSFREISLRTALKIAEIRTISSDANSNWEALAKACCMGGKALA